MNGVSSGRSSARRTYMFKNVSKERIPPYAVMQIVSDPDKWDQAYLADKNVATFSKELHRVRGGQSFFDNQLMLFCDKPSILTEFMQDSSTMAFNGPTAVEPGAKGACSWMEYPFLARSYSNVGSDQYDTYYAVRDKWAFTKASSKKGAYVGVQQLRDELKLPKDGLVGMFNLSSTAPSFFPRLAQGTWSLSGTQGPNPLIVTSMNTEAGESAYSASIVYDSKPTLTLLVPGIYDFEYTGKIEVKNPPNGLTVVPYRIAPVGYYAEGKNRQGSGATILWNPESDGNQRYASRTLTKRPVETGGPPVLWEYNEFTLVDKFVVTRPVWFQGIQQTSSPYVQASGKWSVSYKYDLRDSAQVLALGGDALGFGEFGGYGGFGYSSLFGGSSWYYGDGFWARYGYQFFGIVTWGANKAAFAGTQSI